MPKQAEEASPEAIIEQNYPHYENTHYDRARFMLMLFSYYHCIKKHHMYWYLQTQKLELRLFHTGTPLG